VTHHEYIEVDNTTFFSAAKLDVTNAIAVAVNKTCREHYPSASVWAGEIGPHNGGSPPCDHSSMRWANFGDTAWYLDALATKARAGYQAFCRQDLIGADYGLLDCSTGDPLPDYFAALLFRNLMGPDVLSATVSHDATDASVRAYAHCTRGGGGVTVLVLNLAAVATTVSVDLSQHTPTLTQQRIDYHLTMTDGIDGTGVALNGVTLALTSSGHVPSLQGRKEQGNIVPMAPRSFAFVQFLADVDVCK